MSPEEIAQLVSLLSKLRSNGLLSPNMPLDVWKALHAIVPQPAVELIISKDGKDFLEISAVTNLGTQELVKFVALKLEEMKREAAEAIAQAERELRYSGNDAV